MRNLLKWSLIFIIWVQVSACTTNNKMSNAQIKPVNSIESLTQWTARGKILIVEKGEKQSANFYWRQNGKNFKFSFSTFMGIDVFTLEFKNGLAKITTDGKTFADKSPTRLLQRITQQNIPVKHLPFWIKGITHSSNSSIAVSNNDEADIQGQFKSTLSADGHINEFFYTSEVLDDEPAFSLAMPRQWHVRYNQRKEYKSLNLPKLISIKSDQTRIKLSISKWQF